MITVLVVEDSLTLQEFLVQILAADPEIHVVGTANNGAEALEAVVRHRPDVITMDINMPKMDGFEATRRIMETRPTPIVIVSGSWDPKEVGTTFRAVEAGALTMVPRPQGVGHPAHESAVQELVRTVKLMSEVKVVRRWPRPRSDLAPPPPPQGTGGLAPAEIRAVAIGASTGGPLALQTILSGLPTDFPAPVLIVQHMAPGFVQGFIEWLARSAGFPVHLATNGAPLLPGAAYVAPDGSHMGVGLGPRVVLTRDGPENGPRPSVSFLFRSVAAVFGRNAAAVLLTGMGKDGAEELKALRDTGAVTFAQDRDSAVVHGMPGEAIKLGAAALVLPPEKIAAALVGLAHRRQRTPA